MGRAARVKRARSHGLRLEEAEARALLRTQRDVAQAQLRARELAQQAQEAVRAAVVAQQQTFDGLVKKYGLDPRRRYVLDDERLTLTPAAADGTVAIARPSKRIP